MNRIEPLQASTDVWARRITYVLSVFMRWISAHWLLLVNLFVGLYLGLPILAPLLMGTGHVRVANLIYLIFKPLCHQLPERSFFLFGQQWVYSYDQLSALLRGVEVPARYVGNPEIGFKTAVCQRDVAIYLFMFLAGILFVGLRGWLKPLPFKWFAVLITPMAVDGLGQLFGLWSSTWWSRLFTGGLFGMACVWLAYPYLEQGMREVRRETGTALHDWEARWVHKT